MAANLRVALDAMEGCTAKDLKLFTQVESTIIQMQNSSDLVENFIFLRVSRWYFVQ